MGRRTTLLLTPLLLVPLGCGDDSGPDAEAEARDARDAIAAFEETLAAEGFEPDPEPSDEDDGLEFTSAECRALDELLSDDDEDVEGQTAERESDSYVRSSGVGEETVEGSLTFADNEALLDELEIPDDEQAATCLEEAMRAAFEEGPDAGLEVGEITAELERPDLRDGALRFVISADLTVQGVTLPFVIDALAVVDDRRGATVVSSAVGEEPTVDPEQLVEVLLSGDVPS